VATINIESVRNCHQLDAVVNENFATATEIARRLSERATTNCRRGEFRADARIENEGHPSPVWLRYVKSVSGEDRLKQFWRDAALVLVKPGRGRRQSPIEMTGSRRTKCAGLSTRANSPTTWLTFGMWWRTPNAMASSAQPSGSVYRRLSPLEVLAGVPPISVRHHFSAGSSATNLSTWPASGLRPARLRSRVPHRCRSGASRAIDHHGGG